MRRIIELFLILYLSFFPALVIGALVSLMSIDAGFIACGAVMGFLSCDALIGWFKRLFI